MELWNESLEKENLTTELFRVVGCQSQMGNLNLIFGPHLKHCLYSRTRNLSKSLQSKKLSASFSKLLASINISLF